MASPTQAELDALYDPDKHLLTPGQGSSKVDLDYINRLQNQDSYSPTLTSKALAMINSKVEWNGKHSSFDKLKGLIKGQFKGNGASYLIHHCFLDKYELHGCEVLHFFPRVRLKPKDLEKQNATLYGSLKQICCKGAAKALIWKYEQKRDGMRTWLDLLKRYDNIGSNDVMTIHYNAILTQPYHQNYPGRLEQFTTDCL
jgi:hypothetical protein